MSAKQYEILFACVARQVSLYTHVQSNIEEIHGKSNIFGKLLFQDETIEEANFYRLFLAY